MSEVSKDNVVAADAMQEIAGHRNWFYLFGGLFLLTGLAAIVFPIAAGFALNIVVGVSLLVAGAAALAHTAISRSWRPAGVSFFGGLVDLVAGGLLLFFPIAGVSALAMLLIVWFLLAGAARISVGWKQRPDNGWLAFMLAGGLSVLLGLFVLLGWPAVSAVVLGIMVGVHFIFGGISLLVLTHGANQDVADQRPQDGLAGGHRA